MKNLWVRKWTTATLAVVVGVPVMGLLGVVPVRAANAADQEAEASAVSTSTLSGLALPSGAMRFRPQALPDTINDALKSMVTAVGSKAKQGRVEVLGWTGVKSRSDVAALKEKIAKSLRGSGWTYEETVAEGTGKDKSSPLSVVAAFRSKPTKRALMGYWVPVDRNLILAWTEVTATGESAPEKTEAPSASEASEAAPAAEPVSHPAAPAATPSFSTTPLTVGPGQLNINVMKNAMPSFPSYPKLTPKPGTVRGYVKDAKGKPLAGALIGVRSTAAGGFYSGASATTDDRGYYEIKVPWGVASFYAAGYTIDYGEGRAALGLHPTDGQMGNFASTSGLVKNWVLLSYGVADRDEASDNPKYSGNYYGGTFTVGYWITDDRFDDGKSLPNNSDIEVTLTPEGALLDGTTGKAITIRKHVQEGSSTSLWVNNVPIGTYKISARLLKAGGSSQPLHLKETGPYSSNPFGLDPKSDAETATLTFRPGSAKANMATAGHGNWNSLDITLSR